MKDLSSNNTVVGILCAIACEILFGLSLAFTKDVAQVWGAFALLGWRFVVALVTMSFLVILGIVKINLKGKNIRPLLCAALFSPCLYYIAETIGISHTTASESGVILAGIPVAALIASSLILKKKPSIMQAVGILVTILGVVIAVVAAGVTSSFSIFGYSCLLVAVSACALYCVFVEKAREYSGGEITFITVIAGSLVFITSAVIVAIHEGSFAELATLPFKEPSFAIAVLYQGIGCSVGAFFLSAVAISKIGVNRRASFVGMSTIASVLSGAIVLGEVFTLYQFIGAAIIIAGVYTANSKKNII